MHRSSGGCRSTTVLAWMVVALGLSACGQEPSLRRPLPPVQIGQPLEVGPVIQIDRVLQVVPPTVDLLWVLDSSCSMEPYRASMAASFPAFIEPFEAAGLDYHIGVTTTDITHNGAEGQLQEDGHYRWVQPDNPDPIGTFQRMAVDAIERQQHDEKGFAATTLALGRHSRPGGYNEGFMRRDAHVWLHVTVMSDDDDQSAESEDSSDIDDYRADFLDFMRGLKSNPDRISFNSIVALVDGVDYSTRGREYLAVTEDLGGIVYDIHLGNWEVLMDELGVLQSPAPAFEFFLSRLPVVETIEVRAITPKGITLVYRNGIDYTYLVQRNSVRFVDKLPPPIGSEVQVIYEVRAARETARNP